MGKSQSLLQKESTFRERTTSKRIEVDKSVLGVPIRMSRKKSRRIVDEFIDLYCGPEGVPVSKAETPWDHLYKAWALVGFYIQDAMNEADFRN